MKTISKIEHTKEYLERFMEARDKVNELLYNMGKTWPEAFQILQSLMTDMCIHHGLTKDEFLYLFKPVIDGYEEKMEYFNFSVKTNKWEDPKQD